MNKRIVNLFRDYISNPWRIIRQLKRRIEYTEHANKILRSEVKLQYWKAEALRGIIIDLSKGRTYSSQEQKIKESTHLIQKLLEVQNVTKSE